MKITRSLGARWAPTSSWRPFGPAFCPSGILDFVLHALRALRPCDPRTHSVGNPTNFMEKSNKFHREIQQISLRNPTDFTEKSNRFHGDIQQVSQKNLTNFSLHCSVLGHSTDLKININMAQNTDINRIHNIFNHMGYKP